MIPGEKGPAVSVAQSSFFGGDMKEKGIVFFLFVFLSGGLCFHVYVFNPEFLK